MIGPIRRFQFVIAIFLFAMACSGRAPENGLTGPTLEDSACQQSPSLTPAGLIAGGHAPREVRLYIDGSASMRPFAGQGDRFRAVLAILRPVLLDLGVRQSRVARVGSTVEVLDQAGGFERFDEAAFFSLGETNLAAILNELEAAETSAVTVVMTDGVTSLLQDRGEIGDLGECERGSDVHCLTLKIGRLIEAGNGFWLVGIRSSFRGTLFSETLRVGGASLGEVELSDRPFYLWVITSHPPTGRALVSRILDRLSLSPNGQVAFALELAPGDIPWSLPGEDAPASDSRLFPKGARIGASRSGFVPAEPGKAPLQKVAHQNLEGTAFGLQYPLEPTPLRQIPKGITPLSVYRATYCLRWKGKAPSGSFRLKSMEDEGVLRLALFNRSFAPLAGRQATLVQHLERDSQAGGIPSWLESWSTSDDSRIEAGSKTLNLVEFVRALEERVEPPGSLEQPILRLEFE